MSWENFFHQAGIPAAAAHKYSQSFMKNRIKETDLPDLDRDTLGQLGIQAIGDQLTVLRHIKSGKTPQVAAKPSGSARVRITAETKTVDHTADHTAASTHRKGRPPPDRNEIYHIKMPEGSTERSRKILRQAKFARPEGVRGTTGVRQAGRPVSPIDKKSVAVKSMQKAQTSSHAVHIVRKHLESNTKTRNNDRTLTVYVPPHKNATRTIVQKKVGIVTTGGNRVITRTIEKPDRTTSRVSIGSRVTNRVMSRPSVRNRITFSNGNNRFEDEVYEDEMEDEIEYEGDDNMDDNLYSEEDNGYVEYVEMPRRSIFDRISQ